MCVCFEMQNHAYIQKGSYCALACLALFCYISTLNTNNITSTYIRKTNQHKKNIQFRCSYTKNVNLELKNCNFHLGLWRLAPNVNHPQPYPCKLCSTSLGTNIDNKDKSGCILIFQKFVTKLLK